MIRRMTPPVRRAFTLVELMVAMGLSVLIMYIMAECSKICLDAVSIARSSGQMSSQLQGAGAILSRDLIYSDHFLRDDTRPGGGVKLSQYRFDQMSGTQTVLPPKAGFFRIISPESTFVTPDANNFNINSATNHGLQFTSILPAGDQNLFSVNVNGTPYYSRAAELAYFLVDSGTRTSPGAGGVPLYNLHRRQRLVALTADENRAFFNAIQYYKTAATTIPLESSLDVFAAYPQAANPQNLVYTLEQMADPGPTQPRRFPLNPTVLPGPVGSNLAYVLGHSRFGEDLLLSNVLSFEVLVDWTPSGIASSNQSPRTQASVPFQNWEYPFDSLYYTTNPGNRGRNDDYANRGVFDTWSTKWNGVDSTNWNPATGPATGTITQRRMPLAIRVKQIQVTIRIFDPKTKLARQNTWKFSM